MAVATGPTMISHPTACLVHKEATLEAVAAAPHKAGALLAADQFFQPEALSSGGHPVTRDAVSLGTTIIAMAFKGGVVLAADSRTSTGRSYVVNRVSNKLTKLTDRIYCCRSGSAADTQAMAELASRYLKAREVDTGKPPTVLEAATLIQKLVYANRWEISAGIIVAGYDEINGGSVYNVPYGASIRNPYALGGSGSIFLYSFFDSNYKPDMSKDECVAFARQAVSHALSRDNSSGGVVRTMCIDATGSQHSTTPWTKLPYVMERDPVHAGLAPQNLARAATSKVGDNETRTE